ncbi:MAG: hypothetical protein ACRDSR_13915 [Pseudonocardiaceae bacterium]
MRELDDLIAEIVVDCHDKDECMMAFCTVLGDEILVPFETVFLGIPVDVITIGAGRAPGVVATCRRGRQNRRCRPDVADVPGRQHRGVVRVDT